MSLAGSAAAAAAATPNLATYEQRALYRTALDHLTAGRTTAFKRAKARLNEYALAPYLDYHELQNRLSSANAADVTSFRTVHSDLPVADIVYWRWLKRLGQRRDWQTLLDNYEPTSSAELRCYYLRALYGTGNKDEALSQVSELWIVGKSQPKSCDPLFEVWIHNDYLTYSMVWQRLQLALNNNERQLARYLLRFLEGSHKSWAQSLYNVHVDPNAITRTSRYATDTEYSRRVIRHGIIRLAGRSAEDAATAWQSYAASHDFADSVRTELENTTILALAKDGTFVEEHPESFSAEFAESMATAAIAHRNWAEAQHWIERLAPEAFAANRWQYWLARALSASFLNSERATLTYRALAEERDYYGFLAAERLGLQPRLNHAKQTFSNEELQQLLSIPAVNRAAELYAVDDTINARREWTRLVPQLSRAQQAQAAQLAMQMGWTSQGIAIANAANLRDHLNVRFPYVYRNDFQRVSHATTVPHSFLIAVARQESAFNPSARSSANARGLMQLLHSTASGVARRSGLATPSITDLYAPQINIEIAGHHLAELLVRYQNARPLAAAAYNAGQHRVSRWTKEAGGMPMDIWIENIPFRETRNYVKNVLAFAQVYGQLLGEPTPMLHAHEAAVP